MSLLNRLRRKKTDDQNQYKEVAEYVMENIPLNPEQADALSQRLGIQDRYTSLLREREQGPFRSAYNLSELLSQAWHEKESKALARREETSLERRVESAELVPVEGNESSSLALGYAKVLGKGCIALAKGTYAAGKALIKGTSTVVKELAISSLLGLLPGFILKRVNEKSVVQGYRRCLNNAFAVGYDIAAASAIPYLILEYSNIGDPIAATGGVLGGLVGICSSWIVRYQVYKNENKFQNIKEGVYARRGTIGFLIPEALMGLARLVYSGVTSLHAAAKKEAKKSKLQVAKQGRLESSTTPASPRMLPTSSDEE